MITELVQLGARSGAALNGSAGPNLQEISMFGWTRTQVGLHSFVDTTATGLSAAQSKVDADSKAAATAVAAESTYQTDRTALTGADVNLKINLADNQVVLTAANPGQ